jgi:hypothetical protein
MGIFFSGGYYENSKMGSKPENKVIGRGEVLIS